jgi:hypothetical protein
VVNRIVAKQGAAYPIPSANTAAGRQVNELPFNYLEWLTTLELLEPLRTHVKREYEKRL